MHSGGLGSGCLEFEPPISDLELCALGVESGGLESGGLESGV